jgi:hypothetical protein
MTRDEGISEIATTIQDTAKKLGDPAAATTPDTYLLALKRGLGLFSQFRPRRIRQTVAVGANGRIATSSIADFSESYIDAMRIEYPVIQFGEPRWLGPDDWQLDTMYGDDSTPAIRFVGVIPAAGQECRIAHFGAHAVPATGLGVFAVADDDMPPVISFSSAFGLGMLSNWYKQSSEVVSAGADITTFINKSGLYAAGVKEHYAAGMQFLRAHAMRRRGQVSIVRG